MRQEEIQFVVSKRFLLRKAHPHVHIYVEPVAFETACKPLLSKLWIWPKLFIRRLFGWLVLQDLVHLQRFSPASTE